MTTTLATFSRARSAGPRLAALAAALIPCATALAQSNVLISATPSGAPVSGGGSGGSIWGPAYMTPDLRYVAFTAADTDLVPGDTNGHTDVFVRDMQTGVTERILGIGGQQPNGSAGINVNLSDDGRYCVFHSNATNLVAGDTNGLKDVFCFDRWTGTMRLVSTTVSGTQGNSDSGVSWGDRFMSADGRYVAFTSNATNFAGTPPNVLHIWRKDLTTGALMGVSGSVQGVPANWDSFAPQLSADGRYCAFASDATNLVPGGTNGLRHIFVRDLVSGVVVLASVGPGGVQANGDSDWRPWYSRDGRYVLLASTATNLVAGDTNGVMDLFRRDLVLGTTVRVSVGSGGIQGNGAVHPIQYTLSTDGRYAWFLSKATNLVPSTVLGPGEWSYRRDIDGDVTSLQQANLLAPPTPGETWPTYMSDGQHAIFRSKADNVVPGVTVNGKNQFYLRTFDVCDAPYTYCLAKEASIGCLPSIGWTGTPSLTSGGNLRINASQVISSKLGLLFYGKTQAFYPFFGGVGCVSLPFLRTSVQFSGGSPSGADCSGNFNFDFGSYVASGIDPTLVPGERVCAQYWYRDPQASFSSGLSNAIDFILCP